jgi:hypothetical protein
VKLPRRKTTQTRRSGFTSWARPSSRLAVDRRCAETGREPPDDELRARLQAEVHQICGAGLAELLLVAQQIAVGCRERGVPLPILSALEEVPATPNPLGVEGIGVKPAL